MVVVGTPRRQILLATDSAGRILRPAGTAHPRRWNGPGNQPGRAWTCGTVDTG